MGVSPVGRGVIDALLFRVISRSVFQVSVEDARCRPAGRGAIDSRRVDEIDGARRKKAGAQSDAVVINLAPLGTTPTIDSSSRVCALRLGTHLSRRLTWKCAKRRS